MQSLLLGCVVWTASCTEPQHTELVVVMDTDYAVPTEINRITARVLRLERGREVETWSHAFALAAPGETGPAEFSLPASFGVLPGHDRATVIVELLAQRDGQPSPLLALRSKTGFIRGATLVLPMFLHRRCAQVQCTLGQTCACPGGRACETPGCIDEFIAPETLGLADAGVGPENDSGTVERDAGMMHQDAQTPDATPDAPTCSDQQVRLERVIPNLMFVVDKSGSMLESLDSRTRWEALREALSASNGVVHRLQHVARFGVQSFSGAANGCPPDGERIDVAVDNADAIEASLAAQSPAGTTPTGFTIHALTTYFAKHPPPPGPTTLVLITDGLPNSCGADDQWGTEALVVETVGAAFAAGIETRVLAVGTFGPHFADVAAAGAGVMNGAQWWNASTFPALQSAIEAIVLERIPCSVRTEAPLDCDADVALDGESLRCDDASRGWRVLDDRHIELLGSACESWRSGEDRTLTADVRRCE